MITATQVVDYGELFKVFLFCSGFTVSNLGVFSKAENVARPTREGAAPMVDILTVEGKKNVFLELEAIQRLGKLSKGKK
jgi:hypothetical protein